MYSTVKMKELTCGKDTESVLKVVAILDLILSTLWSLFFILVGGVLIFKSDSEEMKENLIYFGYESARGDLLSIKQHGVALIICALMAFSLGVYLYILIRDGIKYKDYRKCKRWFNICCILVFLTLASMVFNAFSGDTGHPNVIIASYIEDIVFILYDIYGIILMHLYLKDLNRGIVYSPSQLSEADVL